MRAVLIPAEGNPREIELSVGAEGWREMRELLGGNVEALGLGRDDATAYGYDEAKLVQREVECRYCNGSGHDEDEETQGDPCDECRGRGKVWVEGLPENERATALIYGDKDEARERGKDVTAVAEEFGFFVIDASSGDPREPFIAGPIIVRGFNPRTGHDGPIPDDLAEELLAGAEAGR